MLRRGVFFVLLSSLLLPTLSLGLGREKKQKKKRKSGGRRRSFHVSSDVTDVSCVRAGSVCARVTGVCADGSFGNMNPVSIGHCQERAGRSPGDDRIFFFSSQLDKLKQFLDLLFFFSSFPPAGIMVPGVIVHLLCVSVIFCQAVMTGTYSIRTFISVCELVWACWIPKCCCVKTPLGSRRRYSAHFRGNALFGLVFTVDFVSRLHPAFSPSSLLVMIAGCLSTFCLEMLPRYRLPIRSWR